MIVQIILECWVLFNKSHLFACDTKHPTLVSIYMYIIVLHLHLHFYTCILLHVPNSLYVSVLKNLNILQLHGLNNYTYKFQIWYEYIILKPRWGHVRDRARDRQIQQRTFLPQKCHFTSQKCHIYAYRLGTYVEKHLDTFLWCGHLPRKGRRKCLLLVRNNLPILAN